MIDIARAFCFYLWKPPIWPELWRRLLARLQGRPGFGPADRASDKIAAQAWCAERAIDASDLLHHLDIDHDLVDLEALFPAEFAAARERVARVPAKLGGAGNLDLLYTLCEALAATRIIETGVAYGWSSLAILLALRNRPEGKLYSVDLPNLKHRNDRWVGAAVGADLRPRWRLYRMADREGLPRALRAAGQIDLAHYDSDKSAAGRRFAYPLLWQALRPGGLLVSDDIGDNLAFRDFCREKELDCVVVRQAGKYQGVIEKPHA